MCADLAFLYFVIQLFMDTATGLPTMAEQEFNLKLRLMVPEQSPISSYPSINSPTSSLNNPMFTSYQSIQLPQPPVQPMPPLSIRLQPSTMLNQQQHTYDAGRINRWKGIIRPVRYKVTPPLVIHPPVINYHYTPSVYVPPTRLVPIQVLLHKPITTTTTTTMKPIIISGFNTSYDVNHAYNREKNTTPKSAGFAELLKELRAGINEKPEKDDHPGKGAENHPCFKNKHSYNIERLNIGKLDEFDDDDDYDDIDDISDRKVADIRSMRGGYGPRSLLDALRQSKPTPKNVAELKVTTNRSSSRKNRKGTREVLLKQFQAVLDALRETLKKANEKDKDVNNTIKELHDFDSDSEDVEEGKEDEMNGKNEDKDDEEESIE